MRDTICGVDCSGCPFQTNCRGCAETCGMPFSKPCVVAECCKKNGFEHCSDCKNGCSLRQSIMDEVNSLSIPGMPPVRQLFALRGGYVNLTYAVSGHDIRFLDDDAVYLGTQLEGAGSGRCFGLVANEQFILVCTYGENGSEPELVLYKKR